MYARVVKMIQSRKFLEDDSCVEQLKTIVLDEDVAHDIVNAGRASMGQELNEADLISVNLFANKYELLLYCIYCITDARKIQDAI